MSEYDEKDIETAAAEENVPAEGTLNEAQKKLKRKNEIVRVVKFVLLSASAGVIQLVSFTILNELAFRGVEEGVGYWVPYLISLVLSVIIRIISKYLLLLIHSVSLCSLVCSMAADGALCSAPRLAVAVFS